MGSVRLLLSYVAAGIEVFVLPPGTCAASMVDLFLDPFASDLTPSYGVGWADWNASVGKGTIVYSTLGAVHQGPLIL